VCPDAIVAASSADWAQDSFTALGVFLLLGAGLFIIGSLLWWIAKLAAGMRAWATKQQLERKALLQQTAPVHGFPVVTEPGAIPGAGEMGGPLRVQDIGRGPGRYRIVGVVSATGTDIRMYVDAETPANAKVKAELKGVIVTEVEKQ
jgi:hypothetical protein